MAVDDGDLRTLGFVKYGTQTLEVELPDGSRRRAANVVRGQMELDSLYKEGDTVLVASPDGSGADVLTARSHWRLGPMAWAFGLFAVLLVAFGGWVGLNALSSFLLCCLVIWRVVVPLTLAGWNASLVALLATAAMTAVVMLLVGGWTRKAAAAFGGSMLGVAAGLGLAHLFGRLMGVNGATLPFVQTLVYSGAANLDLADVFIAATVIAGSGAMMDLAMDIAAGVREVARHNATLGLRELLLSGLRIGRATVGTMTTTLLLAYSGGYLSLLMVFAAQGTPPADFLNSPLVAAEVAKTLVGSFAIVLVAPFTALLAAALFARRAARAAEDGDRAGGKLYLSANDYLDDAWRLAAAVRAAGWRPDLLVALWRGGAPVGVAVHEFLKTAGWDVRHLPLKCASYTGIGENAGGVAFTHGEAVFGSLRPGERVLVVDDVFDTGRTAEAVRARVAATGAEMRLACVYWKPQKNETALRPDCFVRELGPEWIVFPHEVEGLSAAEIEAKNPLLARLLARPGTI